MKIVQINSTCGYGSIGKICQAISELLLAKRVKRGFPHITVQGLVHLVPKKLDTSFQLQSSRNGQISSII